MYKLFLFFQLLEINEKKIIIIMIFFFCRIVFGLLLKLYCEKENFCIAKKTLYCDIVALDVQERWIVLHDKVCIAVRHLGWAGSVLQYTALYCREEGSVVLQDCIARDLAGDNLYRNIVHCIVTR